MLAVPLCSTRILPSKHADDCRLGMIQWNVVKSVSITGRELWLVAWDTSDVSLWWACDCVQGKLKSPIRSVALIPSAPHPQVLSTPDNNFGTKRKWHSSLICSLHLFGSQEHRLNWTSQTCHIPNVTPVIFFVTCNNNVPILTTSFPFWTWFWKARCWEHGRLNLDPVKLWQLSKTFLQNYP